MNTRDIGQYRYFLQKKLYNFFLFRPKYDRAFQCVRIYPTEHNLTFRKYVQHFVISIHIC
jgi:hypothetical protein